MYAKLVIEAFCGNMSLTRTPFIRYNSVILCYEATHCKITAAVSILSTTKEKAIVPSPVVATVPSPSPNKSLNISFIKPNDSHWTEVITLVQKVIKRMECESVEISN